MSANLRKGKEAWAYQGHVRSRVRSRAACARPRAAPLTLEQLLFVLKGARGRLNLFERMERRRKTWKDQSPPHLFAAHQHQSLGTPQSVPRAGTRLEMSRTQLVRNFTFQPCSEESIIDMTRSRRQKNRAAWDSHGWVTKVCQGVQCSIAPNGQRKTENLKGPDRQIREQARFVDGVDVRAAHTICENQVTCLHSPYTTTPSPPHTRR